jgi:hypothetical protein
MRRARTRPVTGAKRLANQVIIKTPPKNENVNINKNNPLQIPKKMV